MGKYSKNISLQVLLIILFTVPKIQGQDSSHFKPLRFEQITKEQGLSSNYVYSILKDSKGFLWFGTEYGLNRYDGNEFTVYHPHNKNEKNISRSNIASLYEDKRGTLWIGTFLGGLNKFNRQDETFVSYKSDPLNPNTISNNNVYAIYESKSLPGILWVGTQLGGLNKFDSKSEKFIQLPFGKEDGKSLSHPTVLAILESAAEPGVLWIATGGGGLNRFDPKINSFKYFKNDTSNPNSLSSNYIWCLYEIPEHPGFLWIGTQNGLNIFDIKNEKFTSFKKILGDKYSLSSDTILCFSGVPGRPEILNLGTQNGGWNRLIMSHGKSPGMLIQNDIRFISYKEDLNRNSLSGNLVRSIFEDTEYPGIIWIGTKKGITKITEPVKNILHIRKNPSEINSLINDAVAGFLEDENNILWIGTHEGLSSLTFNSNGKAVFKNWKHNPENPKSLSGNIIHRLLRQKNDPEIFWLGTISRGLNKVQLDHNSNIISFSHYFPKHTVLALMQSEKNPETLWLGTFTGGLIKFNVVNNTYVSYKQNPQDEHSISTNFIYSLWESINEPDVIWIGTAGGGLNKFNYLSERFKVFRHDINTHNSLSNDVVYTIHQSTRSPEILWIGTGFGLNRFDTRSESFRCYTTDEGLCDNSIKSIIEDDYGILWISTEKGISSFNPETELFRNYDVHDGLQDDQFLQSSAYKTSKGDLLFGGVNGFNIINPSKIKSNTIKPKIVITDFQVLNKSVPVRKNIQEEDELYLEKSIIETDYIELSHDNNFLSFKFASLDFTVPAKNQYAYKMEGLDADWIYSGNRRYANYTNMAPGRYTFRVKGSNNDGIWNETGASITIVIHPPWWKNWWAYLIYSAVVLFTLFIAATIYINRQRLKHQLELEHEYAEKEKAISRLKTNFFTNISHELRTPLTLILGPIQKILDLPTDMVVKKQAKLAERNSLRLLDLVNQLLDLSKLDDQKLKLQVSERNIVAFVKGIVMNYESYAERKNIKIGVYSEEENIPVYFDKEKMEKVFTNILSNAFKFTSEGDSVTVSLHVKPPDRVIIKIRDTGIGIPPVEMERLFDRFYQVNNSHSRTHGGTGIGLALTKELVELHKGKIYVNSLEGHWTVFTLELPLGTDSYTEEELANTADEDTSVINKEYHSTEISSDPDRYSGNHHNNNCNDEEKLIILIVEDNSDVREYIKDSLENGYLIEEAACGQEGIRIAEKIIPDLIISDVMMPNMDGCEMTKILKNNDKTNHIPVILLTAKSTKESKFEGLESGADDYLIKPFDSKELNLRIHNLINNRKLLHAKYAPGGNLQSSGDDQKLSDGSRKFIEKIMQIIEKNLSDENFSIEQLGTEMGMSRMQLHRKFKALTGRTTSKFLRSVRLIKAKKLIEEEQGNISEIAYQVGFSSPQYFTRCFKEEFGYPPSVLTS